MKRLIRAIPFRAYMVLAKPRIVVMVLVTSAMGLFLGGGASAMVFVCTLIGTGLAAAGGSVQAGPGRDSDMKTSTLKRSFGCVHSPSLLPMQARASQSNKLAAPAPPRRRPRRIRSTDA